MHHVIIELLPFLPVLFFGIGMGPSKQEKEQFGQLGALSSFATSHGEGDISQADNFWKSILSGDPNQIAKVLGPESSAINKQAQESMKTASEFHNRGGGTNAFNQQEGDRVRTTYDKMVSDLTGQAAGALGASGQSLLSAGLSGHQAAFSDANTIQEQKAAQLGDIFKSITSIAGSIFGGGSLFGPGGGGGGGVEMSHDPNYGIGSS